MHHAVKAFIKKVKVQFPEYFKGTKVVEFGSRNINGTPRGFFEDCRYIGVDWQEGTDVDRICFCHEFKEEKDVDVVISTEMLEHDVHWRESLDNMVAILRRCGLLIVTCAGVTRKPHELNCGIDKFYHNLTEEDISRNNDKFECFAIEDEGEDLRLWAIKSDEN